MSTLSPKVVINTNDSLFIFMNNLKSKILYYNGTSNGMATQKTGWEIEAQNSIKDKAYLVFPYTKKVKKNYMYIYLIYKTGS